MSAKTSGEESEKFTDNMILRLSPELHERLKKASKIMRHQKSVLYRYALEQMVDALEANDFGALKDYHFTKKPPTAGL